MNRCIKTQCNKKKREKTIINNKKNGNMRLKFILLNDIIRTDHM